MAKSSSPFVQLQNVLQEYIRYLPWGDTNILCIDILSQGYPNVFRYLCDNNSQKLVGVFRTSEELEGIAKVELQLAVDPQRVRLEPTDLCERALSLLYAEILDGDKLFTLYEKSFFITLQELCDAETCGNREHDGMPKFKTCSVCKRPRYCSRKCQKKHWKLHKEWCFPKK